MSLDGQPGGGSTIVFPIIRCAPCASVGVRRVPVFDANPNVTIARSAPRTARENADRAPDRSRAVLPVRAPNCGIPLGCRHLESNAVRLGELLVQSHDHGSNSS